MSLNFDVIKGLVLGAAGFAGFYFWFQGGLTRDAGYGVFMLSIVATLCGLNFFMTAMGFNLFGNNGSGDSGSDSWFDSDGGDGD